MRIAIPSAQGKLATHFGHCQQFTLIDVDTAPGSIVSQETIDAPDHQPGLLPRWLAERKVNLVIAGGMGMRAQQLFEQDGIEVITGAPSQTTHEIVTAYLAGSLQTGSNICDH